MPPAPPTDPVSPYGHEDKYRCGRAEIDFSKGCEHGKPYQDNLGGLGPDTGPAEVRYRAVGTRWVKPPAHRAGGAFGGDLTEGGLVEQSFDLVMTNTTPYYAVEEAVRNDNVDGSESARLATSCSLLPPHRLARERSAAPSFKSWASKLP